MTARTKRSFLRFVGYASFFVACFVIFLFVTFPYERLTAFAEQRASSSMGRDVTIERLRPTITGALYMEGVTLGPSHASPPEPGETVIPVLQVDAATVRVGLFALLFGETDVSFDAEVADGVVTGSFEQNEEHTKLVANIEGLRARRLAVVRDAVGLPVKGTIDLDIDLTIPAGKADESSGAIKLVLNKMVIGDGESKLSIGRLMGMSSSGDEDEGMVIQPIKVGPFVLESTVTKGQAEIPRVDATSDDAEFSFEGQISLREPLKRSNIDTYITFKLTDSYIAQDEATQDVMKLVNIYGGKAKRDDGSFGFRIRGPLSGKISFKAAKRFTSARSRDRDRAKRARPRRNKRGSKKNGRPSRPNVPRPRIDTTGDETEDDERAARRNIPRPRPPISTPGRYVVQQNEEEEEEEVEEEQVETEPEESEAEQAPEGGEADGGHEESEEAEE